MRTPLRYAVTAVALAACTGAALLARQSSPRPAAQVPAASKPAAPGQGPLPPLNMTGYALARPAGITKTVYEFVARHPIRASIERKWAPQYPSKTPTPPPPAKKK